MKQRYRQHYCASVKTPFAHLALVLDHNELVAIDFISTSAREISPETAQAKKIVSQIKKYCQHATHSFDVKLRLQGTAFQKSVWREMQKISSGKVKTYGEVAKILKTSPRAVGNACRQNPVPLIVPCHRIVAAGGIGGYAEIGRAHV